MKFHAGRSLVSGLSLAGSTTAVDGTDFTSGEAQVGEKVAVAVGVTVPDSAVSGAISVVLVSELADETWDTQAFATVTVDLVRNQYCRHTVIVDCDGVDRIKVHSVENTDSVAVTGIEVVSRSMVGG